MNYRVINIRATGGAGKSYLIHSFMEKFGAKPIRHSSQESLLGGGGEIRAYKVQYGRTPVYIIGSYDKGKGRIGGADTIRTQDIVCNRIRRFHKRGHVIFEGFIISGLYSRYKALSDEVGGMIWAYLDTPLELCIERISKRNKGKAFQTDNTEAKHRATQATKRKALADGETIVNIRHTQPLQDLCKLLDSLEK